jgi:Fe-S-cluster containining protein
MKNTLLNIYKEIDHIVSDMMVSYPGMVKCKIGCADCCHAVFDISLIEGQLVLEAFRSLHRKDRREITRRAEKALRHWKRILANREMEAVIGKERIRCPFLDKNDICAIYDARPVNCRTYGIPLEIDGQTTVCGLSGFREGEVYNSFNITELHRRLMTLSLELSPEEGNKRWPLASIVLSA